jgi:lipopolysaccharide transport system ATP-binding protein
MRSPMPSEAGPVAIRMRGLSKTYAIYDNPRQRFRQLLWPGKKKFFREVTAIRDVDLDIHGAETVGIVGRNGSGKSTLLKMVCGTIARSSGELEVSGHIAPLLTLGTGFDPEFTGRENVHLNAAILGLPPREIEARMDSIIDFAAIGDFFDQPVKYYSSGMYSRLAFAVAINSDPDILVVDEVLAVGDEAFTRKCFARIEQIKSNGSTILFVSHSASMVIELCDRAVLLEGGERLLTSDPKTVVARYHRLLYAPESKRQDIIDEIRSIDEGQIDSSETNLTDGPPQIQLDRTGKDEPEDLGAFVPGLVSESVVEYVQLGAKIENPRLLDPGGNQVNVLRPGLTYEYTYDVQFDEPAHAVRFGMMLKMPTGFEIGGQASHSAGCGIEFVDAGSTAHITFRFNPRLTAGSYFLNAGEVTIICDSSVERDAAAN